MRMPLAPTFPSRRPSRRLTACIALAASLLTGALVSGAAFAQPAEDLSVDGQTILEGDREALGLPVVSISVVGNRLVGDARILDAARTEVGQPFDPRVAVDDYQRIYALRRFRRVEGRYEIVDAPNVEGGRGVAVVFEVEELPPVGDVRFEGNVLFDDRTLRQLLEVEAGFLAGERGDPVLLGFAVDAIERLYLSRGHSLAQVSAERDETTGSVVFHITEGPRVRVRNIDFLGADSFTEGDLKKEIRTKVWAPLSLFGYNGRFDERTLEEDVASLQRFYRQEKGFFDARVGRRVVWSPTLEEVQIEFLVDEGQRYRIGDIEFTGVSAVDEAALREAITERANVREGEVYDAAEVRAAIEEIVKEYSPFGYIYSPPPPGIAPDPQYLQINPEPSFRLEQGIVDLTFNISEGKSFRVGDIRVRGNEKTQDKVILREFDLAPGDLYDSDDVRQATRRLLGKQYFSQLRITPIEPANGDVENERDILVEVEEQSTAILSFGGSVSSNGGVFGQIRYEQRNFDLFDFPSEPSDLFGDAFTGAGQNFRILLEPGTIRTNASISFFEPYLFDQNFGYGADAYYRTVRRREYRDTRTGGRMRFVPRLGRHFSTGLSIRGEDVRIFDLDDPEEDRAAEIREFEGHTTLTSVGVDVGWSDVDSPLVPTSGYSLTAGWESFGVLGGPSFQRITTGANVFLPLYRDDRDRAVVLDLRSDAGALYNDAPFFERFYAGGFGSVRGFRYRGISPRSGTDDDPVGGDFTLTGSAALSFPIYDRTLRGVVFSDYGSVSEDYDLGTIRVSAGFGFRVNFEALGGVPIALDFAWPLNERDEDDRQVFSFSLGLLQ